MKPVLLALAGLLLTLALPDAGGAASPRDKDRPIELATNAMFGEWREIWDPGQPTDVTVHDQYRIRAGVEPGSVEVVIQNRNQLIEQVRLEDGELTFSQHTDNFVVRYALKLGDNANVLTGTATTPARPYPVRWERTGMAPVEPGPGFVGTAASRRPFYGTWHSEQTTARYRITSNEGRLVIEAWDQRDNEKFEVTEVRMEDDALCATFRMPSTKHTTHVRIKPQGPDTLIEECTGDWTGTITWKRW